MTDRQATVSAFGKAKRALSDSFVNSMALDADIGGKPGLSKMLLPTSDARKLNTQHNVSCPEIKVDPQTFDVVVDGQVATRESAEVLALAHRYMLQ